MKLVQSFSFLVLLLGPVAQAEVLKCSFTEPFYSLEIDTTVGELKKSEPGINTGVPTTTVVAQNVTVKPLAPVQQGSMATFAQYELVGANGVGLLNLVLNYKGSDGMSDIIFPYSAHDLTHGHFGGCETDILQAINPYGSP